MNPHRRVVWSEGMLLVPQHFQQLERSVLQTVTDRFRSAHLFDWGLASLEIDRDALRNGRFALTSASGVFPDGTPFSMPARDPLPSPRTVEGHFDPKRDLLVHLGLPIEQAGRARVGAAAKPGAPGPRYTKESAEIDDGNTGGDARAIAIARPNPVLLFPDDALGDHDAIPIAEVFRDPQSGFALRESYIPPALAIGASAELIRVLEALHGQVLSKSSELANRRREQGGLADFGTGDFRSYLQFHTVNATIPLLQHAVSQRGLHPEELYLVLARLAGELSAFSLKVKPADVPAYEHGALRETFARLRGILTELLESKEIVSTLQIPLEKDGFTHVARLEDARLLEPSTRMFLGVSSDLDEARLIGDLPNVIKIASRDRIDAIIAGGLRGLPIHFEHNPPGTLQTRSMFRYFQIEPRGDEWDAIKGARNLAIFVPAHIPNVTLQLLGHLG